MFDRFLDSLHGWRGFLFVVAWSILLPVFLFIVLPAVAGFLVDILFWPTGN